MIALIITVVVLVILAAVTISAAFNSGIINTAVNGTINYVAAQRQEEEMFDGLSTTLTNAIDKISSGNGQGSGNTQNSGGATDSVLNQLLDRIYPVGSIYITTDLSTKEAVASRLGGTWESFGEGRTLVGVGTVTDENDTSETFVANQEGGELTHQLTVDEMPSHTHPLTYVSGSGGRYGASEDVRCQSFGL